MGQAPPSVSDKVLMSEPTTNADIVGLTWELSSVTGWGVYGTNVALELIKRRVPKPVLLKQPSKLSLTIERAQLLGPLLPAAERTPSSHGRRRKTQSDATGLSGYFRQYYPNTFPWSRGGIFMGVLIWQ